MKKVLQEKLENAQALALEYVTAYNGKSCRKSELKELKSKATRALDSYNKAVEMAYYRDLDHTNCAVRTALREYYIKGGKSFSYKTDDYDVMSLVIKDKEMNIDLPMMQATIGAEHFEDKNWFKKCEALMAIVLENIAEVIGCSFKADISAEARTLNLELNPYDNEGCIEALNKVFEAILIVNKDGVNILQSIPEVGKYGVDSPEWRAIREKMTGEGKGDRVAVCNTGNFVRFVAHAMHKVITNGNFDIEEPDSYKFPEVEEPKAEEPKAEEPKKVAKRGRKKAEKAE